MRGAFRYCRLILLLGAANTVAQVQISEENAYNPIPSPDGTKIVAVRTGWNRPGGTHGTGRSNLVSDLIMLDRAGRTIAALFFRDRFVVYWNHAGIVAFRDWSYNLLSEGGSVRRLGSVCGEEHVLDPTPGCPGRIAYLSTIDGFVWVRQKFGDSYLVTSRGEFSTRHHDKYLGEWLAPSPDERYIAAGPGRLGRDLNIFDSKKRAWINLGESATHPDRGWDWMEPSWSPWFADSSRLVFTSSEGLVISSPDGKQRRTVLGTDGNPGIATPSPDGRAIAYATFASRPRPSAPGSPPLWACTGIWVIGMEPSAKPLRIAGATPSVTYDLRWLDNQHLVFDRIDEGMPPKARLWMATVQR